MKTVDLNPGARFHRVAAARITRILNHIRLLGNCSGAGYDYTQEEVSGMFAVLYAALEEAEARYRKGHKKDKTTGFSFDILQLKKLSEKKGN